MTKAPRNYRSYSIQDWNKLGTEIKFSTVLGVFPTGTVDILAGPVVVKIARDVAAKALRDARRDGYLITRYIAS